MTDEELKGRIESSEGLRRVKDTLLDEVSFRADGSARLDPLTILTIISIVVQVITFCLKQNDPAVIADAVRNARTLPRRKTIRLRRWLKNLSQDYGIESETTQPVYESVVDIAENMSDDEIAEIIQLAQEYAK